MSKTALLAVLRANWAAIGVESVAAIMSSGSVNDETVPVQWRPFVVVRWQTESPAFTSRGPTVQDVDVWMHDDRGNYDRIDNGLQVIKNLLHAASHVTLPDLFPGEVEVGVSYDTLVQADWQSTSGDVYDPGYNTSARYCGYRIVTRTP